MREAILEEVLKPGDRLPEAGLAQRFEVGSTFRYCRVLAERAPDKVTWPDQPATRPAWRTPITLRFRAPINTAPRATG